MFSYETEYWSLRSSSVEAFECRCWWQHHKAHSWVFIIWILKVNCRFWRNCAFNSMSFRFVLLISRPLLSCGTHGKWFSFPIQPINRSVGRSNLIFFKLATCLADEKKACKYIKVCAGHYFYCGNTRKIKLHSIMQAMYRSSICLLQYFRYATNSILEWAVVWSRLSLANWTLTVSTSLGGKTHLEDVACADIRKYGKWLV